MKQKAARRTRPTQADVARLAGVSQAMVSYILNDRATLAIPDDTRQRIRDAMDQLAYVPDRRARSLRTQKTYTIAAIIPDITNPFYPTFERGIQDVAERAGYDVVTYNTDGVAEREATYLRAAQQGHVDGIIAVLFHATAEDLRPLLQQGIVVTRFEPGSRDTGELPLDNIYIDNATAARDTVSYLIGRGHTRIGMVAGHRGPRAARLLGYRHALAAHGIPVDDELIRDTEYNEAGGYQGMRALLALPRRPTAVFAANDLIAFGALTALRAAGLRVPADIALAGFDDIPAARMVSPPLTTVTQFQGKVGRRAAEMVLERLSGNAPPGGRCEEMPYQLVVREST